MVYPKIGKLKPLSIDPNYGTKNLEDHVQTFQSRMHYMGAYDDIICHAF